VSDVHERRIAELDPGESMQDLPDELQHDSFDRRSNRRVSDGTPTEERGGAPNGLRRLRADEPSLTITGSSGSEFVHPTADRFLTLRECARLQSFPDEFEFAGSKTSRQRQIGNAVPPLIAKKLSAHLRGVFEQHETAPYGNTDGRVLGFYLTKADAMSPALDRTREKLSKLRTRTQLSA
jgi:DNA (cytosine-5)-methyltransferase 1